MTNILLLNPIDSRFSLDDILARPTRGSQQSWIYFSRALSTISEIENLDVIFKDDLIPKVEYDIAIIYRELGELQNLKARKKILWTHNIAQSHFAQSCKEFHQAGHLDHIIVATNYHRSTFNVDDYFSSKDEIFIFMDNGIPSKLLESYRPRTNKKKKYFLYASALHRGVDQFIDIWPKLHKKLPDYSLHLSGHLNLYSNAFKRKNPQLYSNYEEILQALSKMPSVYLHDMPDREQYCQLVYSSEALLYPGHTRQETSCITVHEAIALGCPPVVSSTGALPEVVIDGITGFVVPGKPASYLKRPDAPKSVDFRDRFINTVVNAARTDGFKALRTHRPPNIFSWEQQARALLYCLLNLP